jgi:hypothetical protein
LVFGRVAVRFAIDAVILALKKCVADQVRQFAITETGVGVGHAIGLAGVSILVALDLARFVSALCGAIAGPPNLIAGAVAGNRLSGTRQKE